ncbi:MAG: hypothetical protein A4E55_01314 [Pelotomaculum sp. PtaU1.Bin035]|nr:MAG: hypothetical protein A4E55_01314 [Pelotomaculum sp. PtaU1.Bin035]
MRSIACIIALLFLLFSSLTGCFSAKEEPQQIPSPQVGGPSSATGLIINVPEISKVETINVPGNVGPGQRVFINETETLVDAGGNFNAQVKLVPGQNPITVKVVSSDNKSIYTTVKNVNYTPSNDPALSVIIPSSYSSETETLIIKGTTDPGCQIDVNGNRSLPDEKGNFIVSVPLEKGDNIVKVVSTNPKGKTSTVQQVVNFNKLNNKQPTLVVSSPEPTKDGYVSTDKINVSGFTEPNNLIEIYNNYYNGDTNVKSLIFKGNLKNGQFSVNVTLSKEGGGVNDLLIVATNEFGGSTSETRTVIYKEPPK